MINKRPVISIIAAMTEARVIGLENSLPWKLPADMQWFRQHTLGKPVIMGRKTYESFGGRPLPERHNIVVTRDRGYDAGSATLAGSITDAIASAGDVDEIMIIGGASFYEQTLPLAARLYLTLVHTVLDGDVWFPEYKQEHWDQVERLRYAADEKNQYAMTFSIFHRRVTPEVQTRVTNRHK